jgi:dTDP-4-amino-4,6-dideoxygalactose transaminase
VAAQCSHVWHIFSIRCEQRDDLAQHLSRAGIQSTVNYPVALPFLPAYAGNGARPEQFPSAFENQKRVLSLPVYPELSDGAIARIAKSVDEFFLDK